MPVSMDWATWDRFGEDFAPGGRAPAPGCGMGDILVDDVRTKLEMIPTVAEADVELVFDPPWNRTMMSEAARLETGLL